MNTKEEIEQAFADYQGGAFSYKQGNPVGLRISEVNLFAFLE